MRDCPLAIGRPAQGASGQGQACLALGLPEARLLGEALEAMGDGLRGMDGHEPTGWKLKNAVSVVKARCASEAE